MWIQALLLLLACCLWPAEAQSERTQTMWDEPIKFSTKSKDQCIIKLTGHSQYTKMRVLCEKDKKVYWCEYVGKPQTCRPYNKNPRHYFVQLMWTLRKLHNACRAPRRLKPHMCRSATDESQMVYSTSSYFPTRPGTRSTNPALKPQPNPAPTRRASARQVPLKTIQPTPAQTTASTTPQLTTAPVESTAKRMAHQYCWRSLQGVCSYVIGLFRRE